MNIARESYVEKLFAKSWNGNHKMWEDNDGVTYVGVIPFLLEDIIDPAVGEADGQREEG